MFKSLLDLFKKKPTHHQKQATADEVRKYAKVQFITPARQKGEKRVSFNARQVHSGMGLNSSYPLVCNSIDAKKFEEFARVKLVKRDGVKQGVSASWQFKLL